MNVAILVWGLKNGGAERAAGLLSVYLSAMYNVYLFLRDTEGIMYKYAGQIVDVEPDLWEYCEENVANAKEKYDIQWSISFLDDMNYINIRTRKKDHVIVSARCTLSFFDPPHDASMYAMRKLFNLADAIVAVSNGVKHEMVDVFGVEREKIYTIYNFIQQDDIRRKAREKWSKGVSFQKRLLVSIGRLDKQKNYSRLLEQFSVLKGEMDDVYLLIIGSGDEERALREEISRKGLEEDVGLLPYCGNPFPYLAQADLYVMSSRFEGLPNVLLEAMCLGIPIVAVDCLGGPRELLEGKSDYENSFSGMKLCPKGILVEDARSDDDGTTHYLKKAMAYLLNHPSYAADVRENERKYMESYSNERIFQQWLSVLRKAASNPALPYDDGLDYGKRTVIYGAGKLGKEALLFCRRALIGVFAFLVSEGSSNPAEIDGIPVLNIGNFKEDPANTQILLGLTGKYHDEVIRTLQAMGYHDIHFVHFKKEYELPASQLPIFYKDEIITAKQVK